jgi:hypothetical protein
MDNFSLTTKRIVIGHLTVCQGCCCGNTENGRPPVPVEWLKREWRARGLLKRVQLNISGYLRALRCSQRRHHLQRNRHPLARPNLRVPAISGSSRLGLPLQGRRRPRAAPQRVPPTHLAPISESRVELYGVFAFVTKRPGTENVRNMAGTAKTHANPGGGHQ